MGYCRFFRYHRDHPNRKGSPNTPRESSPKKLGGQAYGL
jgi:hypothetical protein